MAFFTRQGLSVPEIPIDSASTEELANIPSGSTETHFLENSNLNTIIKYNTHIPLSLKNSSGNSSSDNGLEDVRGVEV